MFKEQNQILMSESDILFAVLKFISFECFCIFMLSPSLSVHSVNIWTQTSSVNCVIQNKTHTEKIQTSQF